MSRLVAVLILLVLVFILGVAIQVIFTDILVGSLGGLSL